MTLCFLRATFVGLERVFASFCLCVLLLTACESAAFDAELLAVASVGPADVREGQSLVVDGTGFEAGQDGELILSGTYARPGELPRGVQYHLPAHALSGTRVAARVGAADFERLGGRGTFSGRVSVEFAAEASGAVLRGALDDVLLDFQPRGAVLADRLDEEGASAARELGLDAADESLDGGLVLRQASGSAAAAGLRAGDTVVFFAGVQVHAHSDLLLPPDGAAIPIAVAREGVRGLVHLQLPGTATPPVAVPWTALGLLMIVLLLVGLPARALGRYCWSLREAWSAGGMVSQGLLALAAGLLAALSHDLLQVFVLVLAFVYALTRSSPLQAVLHASPVVGVLFYASRLVPSGALAPETWPCVRDPLMLALFVVGFIAVASADQDKSSPAVRWLERAFRAVALTALVAAFVSSNALVVCAVAFVVGIATPPLPASVVRSAVLLVGVLGIALLSLDGIRLAPPEGVELGLVPLALVVALASAWVSTRARSLRVSFGL